MILLLKILFHFLKRFIVLNLFLICSNVVFTQFNLSISYSDDLDVFNGLYNDSVGLQKEIQRHKFELQKQGYIESNIEVKRWVDSSCIVIIKKGNGYIWDTISESELLLQVYGELNIFKTNNPIHIDKAFQKVLEYCDNNGYPFASISFSEIKINDYKINAIANLKLNDLIIIDSILIKGKTKTRNDIIYKHIDIHPKDVYNEKKIKNIQNKINSSAFLSFIRESDIYFFKDKAMLVLYINDESNNNFNGVLGVNTDKKSSKVVLAGDIDLSLNNILKSGENIGLAWRKTKINTQNFSFSFSIPYLFKSSLGLSSEFQSLRQDTSFSNLNLKMGVSYYIQNNSRFTFFIKRNSSNLLSSLKFPNEIPNVNSSKVFYYGLNFYLNKLDYIYNPRSGFLIDLSGSSGIKTIFKNENINNVEYRNIVDKSNQYEITLKASKFFPLFKRSTFLIGAESGNILNSFVFENELYQIGGLKSLRGFNEQGIFASNYYIGKLEYRFLFEKKSALFGFFDISYYENKSISFINDTPFGIGLGVNLGLKSGVFTLSYALGKEQNNPLLIRNSKLHFGFVSTF